MHIADPIAVFEDLGNGIFLHEGRYRNVHADLQPFGIRQEPILFGFAFDRTTRMGVIGHRKAKGFRIIDEDLRLLGQALEFILLGKTQLHTSAAEKAVDRSTQLRRVLDEAALALQRRFGISPQRSSAEKAHRSQTVFVEQTAQPFRRPQPVRRHTDKFHSFPAGICYGTQHPVQIWRWPPGDRGITEMKQAFRIHLSLRFLLIYEPL